MSAGAEHDPAPALATQVHVAGGSKPFGQLTVNEVGAHAAELRSAAGWGPMARVAPVAMAWANLHRQMHEAGARTVADLDPAALAGRLEALWIVMPGSSDR